MTTTTSLPMTLSLHSASAPIFVRMLTNLATWLGTAQDHADTIGFDSGNYLTQRMAPDMLPFATQIRIACDVSRMSMARLAGVEWPKVADDETTLAALIARVRHAIAYVESITVADLVGAETRDVVVPQRGRDALVFNAENFVQRWALPNLFFHVTTTYAMLRQAGVKLGKADYLGAL